MWPNVLYVAWEKGQLGSARMCGGHVNSTTPLFGSLGKGSMRGSSP